MWKFKKTFLALSSIFIAAFSTPLISSCSSNSNKIYFGNFQSYMNTDVMNDISNEYNAEFKAYPNNETLLREFGRNYDIAIPSSYAVIELIKRDQLLEINWSSFDIVIDGKRIENADDALDLFIPEIHPILTGYDFDDDGNNDNLLKYSVPYFLQDFILGYKAEQIEFSKETYDNWENVLIELKDKLSDGNISRGISIDDPRTLYSLGKLISNPNIDVNPSPEENTIEHFNEIYSFLTKYFEKNQMIFNSDSGNVLNDLAHPNGSGFGFMYNGDVIYSMLGGDSYNEASDLVDINFVRPTTGSVLALDFIVINKKSESNSEKIHQVINDIALKGISNEEIDEESLAFANFDYVLYTSPIKHLYDYVIDPSGYFSYLEDEYLSKKAIDAFKVPANNALQKIENTITNLQKSNMLISYLFTKNGI